MDLESGPTSSQVVRQINTLMKQQSEVDVPQEFVWPLYKQR